jgi:hypothetical protein
VKARAKDHVVEALRGREAADPLLPVRLLIEGETGRARDVGPHLFGAKPIALG